MSDMQNSLAIAMDDLAHVLICGELSQDCEHCSAAREHLRQYREPGYPSPGQLYTVRIPKAKEPGEFWLHGRRILSVEHFHQRPIRYQQTGSKAIARCTVEEWNKWVKNAALSIPPTPLPDPPKAQEGKP